MTARELLLYGAVAAVVVAGVSFAVFRCFKSDSGGNRQINNSRPHRVYGGSRVEDVEHIMKAVERSKRRFF